jgi:hypothetical protein
MLPSNETFCANVPQDLQANEKPFAQMVCELFACGNAKSISNGKKLLE